MGALLYILCTLLFLKILRSATIKLKLCFLKKEIKKNPLIGEKDLDGTLLYKKNGYTLRYSIEELPSGEKKIQWISYKLHLTALEEFIYKIKIFFQRLILYSRLKPSLIFSFFLIVIVIYIWTLIPEPTKIGFYKSLISHTVGVSPKQIEYKGRGWFEIYGKRIVSKERHVEPFVFTVNPWRWLFFSDAGFVTRWRGKESGYKTHYLKIDKEGKISTVETGQEAFGGKVKLRYLEGKVEGDKIKWRVPGGAEPGVTEDIKITEEGIRVIGH